MSIVTRTGDAGTTGLMYNRRVPKCHPRVEACGAVDELNAALGLARAAAGHDFVREHLLATQKDLVTLMGELATLPEDFERYTRDGYPLVTPPLIARLDLLAKEIESQNVSCRGWAIPGKALSSASLDVARTICRRAERRVCALQEANQLCRLEPITYLNRLSDVLWLLARWAESQADSSEEKAG